MKDMELQKLRPDQSKKIAYFPLKFLLSFLIFTEIFFFVGPINYRIPSQIKLFIFLFVNNLTFYMGYRRGVGKYRYTSRPRTFSVKSLHYCIVGSLCIIPVRIHALWGIHPLSPLAIIAQLVRAVNAPGLVYSDKLELVSGVSTYLNIFFSPLLYITIARSLFEFNHLKGIWKYLGWCIIAWEILIPLGTGVRKSILDTGLMIFFLLIARSPSIIFDQKAIKKYTGLALIGVILFLSYFIYSNISRYNINDIGVLVSENSIFNNVKQGYSSCNPVLLAVICSVESYLCQGYYALGIALCWDFTYSGGVGSSWFGINVMRRLGIEILPYTYVGQLQTVGIDPLINWHSMYTWLASDFTFWGVPLFMYFVGNFLSVSWLDTVNKRTVYAAPMFVLFAIMTFYAFANNQVFSLSFIAFVIIFYLWLFNRNNNEAHRIHR